MRSFLTVIGLLVGAMAPMSTAAQLANASGITKLANFSFACDEPQTRNLLATLPADLDINTPAGSLSAMKLAMSRLAKAQGANDAYYLKACAATMKVLASDGRYKFTEFDASMLPDLMYAIDQGKDLANDQGAAFAGTLAATYATVKDFDINYQTIAGVDVFTPRSVAGSIAQAGVTSTWCVMKRQFPKLAEGIDKRSGTAIYTPLLIATFYGKLDMVKLLIGEGADWQITLSSSNDPWPIQAIAHNSPNKELEPWLIQHKQATAPPKKCG